MAYTEHRPDPALRGLVECGWTVTGAAGGRATVATVLPDGCMDLLWTGSALVLAGPDTVAKPAVRAPGVVAVGLRFRPGVLPALLGVPADAVRDRRVPLTELCPAPARAATALLETGEEPLTVLTGLVRHLPGGPPDRAVSAVAARLAPAAGGAGSAAVSAAELADALGCTTRTLHRRCRAAFGYGPAVLRRVLRFRRAAALLAAGVAPAEAAARAGYADQPHLSREVRALAGTTPVGLAAGTG